MILYEWFEFERAVNVTFGLVDGTLHPDWVEENVRMSESAWGIVARALEERQR